MNFCKESPKHLRTLFQYASTARILTTAKIRELFDLEIRRSDDQLFQTKLKAMKFFFDYLDDIESKYSKYIFYALYFSISIACFLRKQYNQYISRLIDICNGC